LPEGGNCCCGCCSSALDNAKMMTITNLTVNEWI
jgi:hypothetical protein